MRIGFDYGGTKIAGIALDDDGDVLAEGRIPTPRFDYDGGIAAIRDFTARLEAEAGRRADSVGIGVPGSVDKVTGRVSLGNSVWLNDRDLRGDLTAALERPVKIGNDANCFALSEAVDGAGKGADVVFGVILGTGVGGGIVVHGRPVEGANAVGGEWGHIPLQYPKADELPGPVCSCGVAGHVEAWLSGPNLKADHARSQGIAVEDAPDAHEIDRLAAAGDAAALATIQRYEDRLGRSLSTIINVLDPDVIVLGGGVSNIDRLYRTLPETTRPHVFGDKFNTRIVKNIHGDASGVRGAAWL